MEPVRRTPQSRNLLALLAGVLIVATAAYFWLLSRDDAKVVPMSVYELDNSLMETGREEFVQLPAPAPKPSDAKLREAQAALRAHQPDTALKIADELLDLDASDVAAHIIRGQAFRRKGELIKALIAYTQAIKIKPDLPELYLYRGHIHKASQRFEQALADYDRALELNPELVAAYYHRGDVLLRQEEHEQALADFTLAITKQSGSARPLPTPFYKRGYLLYLLEEHKAAVRDLSRAIELAPNMYEAYFYRANALCALRRHELAIRDYNELIRLQPDYALGYFGRGLALRESGREKQAVDDFRKAEQLGLKLEVKMY